LPVALFDFGINQLPCSTSTCSARTAIDLGGTGTFLEHCYRRLQAGGVLLVISGKRLPSCKTVLAVHFRDLAVYKLTDPEAARFSQVVARKTTR
jgi:hypothetical protein